jgi:hypothetical protein
LRSQLYLLTEDRRREKKKRKKKTTQKKGRKECKLLLRHDVGHVGKEKQEQVRELKDLTPKMERTQICSFLGV